MTLGVTFLRGANSFRISTKVQLYRAADKVCSALRYRNMNPLGHRHEYTGGFPHEVSATDTSCTLVQCRGASAIWYVNHWWRHRRLLGLAMLHAWTLSTSTMMLCVWWWIPTKAESQWPAGEDCRVALATSASTRFRRMPTLYCYLRCGDLRSPGVT